MDTSKEYIEMCEKAVEIQQNWKPRVGDYYYDPRPHNCRKPGVYLVKLYTNLMANGKRRIFIPLQDQLQATIKKTMSWWGLNDCFHEWSLNERRSDHDVTMEQLWLAFVMKEKFNKIWNGTAWIKEQP